MKNLGHKGCHMNLAKPDMGFILRLYKGSGTQHGNYRNYRGFYRVIAPSMPELKIRKQVKRE